MPRVTPFYAVKCNPDGAIMRCLAALGCGFDCASAKEMADVLAMGVPPRRIIFAAPCKRPTDLGYAVAAGVTVRRRRLPVHKTHIHFDCMTVSLPQEHCWRLSLRVASACASLRRATFRLLRRDKRLCARMCRG